MLKSFSDRLGNLCKKISIPLNVGNLEEIDSNKETKKAEDINFNKTVNRPEPRPTINSQTEDEEMWRKNQEEPVILTLSSDDEEEEGVSSSQGKGIQSLNQELSFKLQNQSTVLEPINSKEPIISQDHDYTNYKICHQNYPDSICDDENGLQSTSDFFVSLQCRSIRIGSYKVVPINRVMLTYQGIKFSVPPFAEGETEPVDLVLQIRDLLKVLAHFGSALPVLFFYVTSGSAAQVRKQLKMVDSNGFYFDPCSNEESQRRVTFLPEVMKEDVSNLLKNFLSFEVLDRQKGERRKVFDALNQKDANEILVRSSPVEIESILLNSKATVNYETRTLLVFPPPPGKGGISITMDDYLCLKDEQFLNDVLVDFYFKWLHTIHFSAKDRDRTHVFSTFFYKRLTSKPKNPRRSHSTEDDPKLSPAQKRHARVRSWTKNVDIFDKDFILVPINEHSHWFLAVICFPGLDGSVTAKDGQPVPRVPAVPPSRVSRRQKKKVEQIPIVDDGDWSDRDEADGDENELDDDDEFIPGMGDDDGGGGGPPRKKMRRSAQDEEEDNAIHQPCIVILDSLAGASRSRIVATLRDYLTVEHEQRRGAAKVFSRDTMQGACPKVPQQNNFSDCGLFTLQFAQSFFETPLRDYGLPIRNLIEWFDQDVVARKREAVADLIRSLMDEHKPGHCITLPAIYFGKDNKGAAPTPTDTDDAEEAEPTSLRDMKNITRGKEDKEGKKEEGKKEEEKKEKEEGKKVKEKEGKKEEEKKKEKEEGRKEKEEGRKEKEEGRKEKEEGRKERIEGKKEKEEGKKVKENEGKKEEEKKKEKEDGRKEKEEGKKEKQEGKKVKAKEGKKEKEKEGKKERAGKKEEKERRDGREGKDKSDDSGEEEDGSKKADVENTSQNVPTENGSSDCSPELSLSRSGSVSSESEVKSNSSSCSVVTKPISRASDTIARDEPTNVYSCSNTIKYLNSLIGNRLGNGGSECKSDSLSSESDSGSDANGKSSPSSASPKVPSGKKRKYKRSDKERTSSKKKKASKNSSAAPATSPTTTTTTTGKVCSSLQFLCDNYDTDDDDDDDDDDDIFVTDKKKSPPGEETQTPLNTDTLSHVTALVEYLRK